jgi:pilus assembly protein CpaE
VARTVRVIIVNTDESVAPDLRAVLLSVEGVKIVAELDEPALLAQALMQFPAEVLLVHLDPNPAGMMDVLAPLIEARKERLAAIGMTEDRDAELVVRAMRAGMREFLWKPFPPEQLSETIRRVAAEFAATGGHHGRLISVVGTCGGVGATQLVTNLAVELSQLESWAGSADRPRPRVCAVDLDFRFGQVAMQLDAQPTYTIAELCETPEQIDLQMIERAMCKHPSGVHVLSRPADFQQAERISAGQCAAALAALQEHYDFVVVDVPARFDPSSRAVFDMSDTFLLVLQLVVPSVRNTDRILQELARSGYALERVRLVCNRFGREAGYLEQADVEATLRRRLDFLIPDDWKTASAAVNMGAPLAQHSPKSRMRLAYRKVAQELAGEGGSSSESAAVPAEGASQKKGLFAFLAGAAGS